MSRVCTFPAGHLQPCGAWVEAESPDILTPVSGVGLCLKEIATAAVDVLMADKFCFMTAAQYLTSKGWKLARLHHSVDDNPDDCLTYSVITPQRVISYADRAGIMTLAWLAYRRELALQ